MATVDSLSNVGGWSGTLKRQVSFMETKFGANFSITSLLFLLPQASISSGRPSHVCMLDYIGIVHELIMNSYASIFLRLFNLQIFFLKHQGPHQISIGLDYGC